MKTISKLFCGLLLFLSTSSYSQQMNCQWLNYCQTGPSYISDVCVDLNSNSIALGYFKDISIQGVSLMSNPLDQFNIFISKMDSSGNLIWLKHVGEGNENIGKSILADSEGNIIFTGCFTNNITICDTTLLATSSQGELIVKLDMDGNCLWKKYIAHNGTVKHIQITLDENDNIYLVTAGNIIIDGNQYIGETVIVKFNKYGQIIWAKSIEIELYSVISIPNNTVIMNSDKLIIGGYYNDTISFAGISYISGLEMSVNPYTGDTTYFSSREALIGVVDTSGIEIKAVNITAVGEFSIEALTTNGSDAIFLSGIYYSDSIEIADYQLSGGTGFLAEFSDNFDLVEVRNINPITVYGATTSNNFTYYSGQDWDYLYINIYDFDCNFIDSIIIGDNNLQPEYPTSLAKFPDNDILLGGTYMDEIVIDTLFAPGDPYSNFKMFVTRFNDFFSNLSETSIINNPKLYPNPIINNLNVDIENLKYMELYDIRGALIRGSITDKVINFYNYDRGIYFLKIYTYNNVIFRKVIKQ